MRRDGEQTGGGKEAGSVHFFSKPSKEAVAVHLSASGPGRNAGDGVAVKNHHLFHSCLLRPIYFKGATLLVQPICECMQTGNDFTSSYDAL